MKGQGSSKKRVENDKEQVSKNHPQDKKNEQKNSLSDQKKNGKDRPPLLGERDSVRNGTIYLDPALYSYVKNERWQEVKNYLTQSILKYNSRPEPIEIPWPRRDESSLFREAIVCGELEAVKLLLQFPCMHEDAKLWLQWITENRKDLPEIAPDLHKVAAKMIVSIAVKLIKEAALTGEWAQVEQLYNQVPTLDLAKIRIAFDGEGEEKISLFTLATQQGQKDYYRFLCEKGDFRHDIAQLAAEEVGAVEKQDIVLGTMLYLARRNEWEEVETYYNYLQPFTLKGTEEGFMLAKLAIQQEKPEYLSKICNEWCDTKDTPALTLKLLTFLERHGREFLKDQQRDWYFNCLSPYNMTCMLQDAQTGNWENVRIRARYRGQGKLEDIQTEEGITLVHLAIQQNAVEEVKWLLQKGDFSAFSDALLDLINEKSVQQKGQAPDDAFLGNKDIYRDLILCSVTRRKLLEMVTHRSGPITDAQSMVDILGGEEGRIRFESLGEAAVLLLRMVANAAISPEEQDAFRNMWKIFIRIGEENDAHFCTKVIRKFCKAEELSEKGLGYLKQFLSKEQYQHVLDTQLLQLVKAKGVRVEHIALRKEWLEYFLQEGANVHSTDSEGRSALHYAVSQASNALTVGQRGDICALVDVLLENGASPDAQDRQGITPLMSARHSTLTEKLLQKSEKPYQKDNRGHSFLHYVMSMHSYDDIASYLHILQQKYPARDFSTMDSKDSTLLHQLSLLGAIRDNSAHSVEQMEKLIVSVKPKTQLQQKLAPKEAPVTLPPLGVALLHGNKHFIHAMLRTEAHIKEINYKGNSYLHLLVEGYAEGKYASLEGEVVPIVRELIEKGVTVNATNKEGKTAIQCAKEKGFPELANKIETLSLEVQKMRDQSRKEAVHHTDKWLKIQNRITPSQSRESTPQVETDKRPPFQRFC